MNIINGFVVFIVFVLGDMVITSDKYQTICTTKSIFEDQMILTIKSVEKHDLGSYRCIAKNSLGEVESNIRLYGKQFENSANDYVERST